LLRAAGLSAGALALLACSTALAQDAATGLRGTSAPLPARAGASDDQLNARSGGLNLTPADSAAPATTRGAAEAQRPGTRRRPPATRRSRAPTSAIVRAPIRATLAPAGLAPEIQPPQTGLPDPALPAVPPRRKAPLDDPYAPLGLRLGNVMLYPMVGESLGYDSNPNRSDKSLAKGSFVSQTEGELRIQSDWSRHELTGSLRGAYNEYPDFKEASRPEGAGRIGLRLDVARDTIVDTEAHYQLDTQRPGSPNLDVIVRERPIVNSEGASVGVTQRFNRLAVTLRGTFDRSDYENATLSDGTVLDQGDRNLNQYGARLRFAYEFNPGFIPFIEGLGDARDYDRKIDDSGYRRSSTGAGARVGTSFELTRLLTGEISAGAIQRSYDDPRLRTLTSPLVDASLIWAASPITTVRLNGQTTVDETTVVGSNGVVASRASLEVAHDLRRNLTITPGINIFENDYKGVPITERGFGGSLKIDYRLTRSISVRASYIYEQLKSSLPGSDYTTNVVLVGMRFQP
jgi:hypothetical protein